MATATREAKQPANDLPEWARYIVARWGLHSKAIDPPIWERIFDRCLREWTAQEIMETVDWQKSEGQSWKKPDSADSIIIAVRCYRKRGSYKEPPSSRKDLDPDRVNANARAMKAARTNLDRWKILCEGSPTLPECQRLDEWAENTFPDWERDRQEIKRRVARDLRLASEGMLKMA